MALTSVADIRRQEISAAALRVLASEGASAMTIERISREIQASKGIVLHYFRTKNELQKSVLNVVFKRISFDLRQRLPPLTRSVERLSSRIEHAFSDDLYTAEHAFAWLSMLAQAPHDPQMARFRHVIGQRLRRSLRYDLRPLVGATEARPIADSLAALIDGLWLRRALEPHTISPAQAEALAKTHLDESLSYLDLPTTFD